MGFWGTEEKGYFSGEQRSNFEGNLGTKIIFGNRERIRKQILGNTGTSQFTSGNKGTGTPLGGPQ